MPLPVQRTPPEKPNKTKLTDKTDKTNKSNKSLDTPSDNQLDSDLQAHKVKNQNVHREKFTLSHLIQNEHEKIQIEQYQ